MINNSPPDTSFHVLVVLKPNTDLKTLPIQSYEILMENILSTNLTSSEIEKLSSMECVSAVEFDEQMDIL